jgi:hypothetical protein
MPFCCKHCNKPFKDNYALNRHLTKKTPCVYQDKKTDKQLDSSGVTIINQYITINQQINQFGIIVNEHVGKRYLESQIDQFNDDSAFMDTGKTVINYRKMLNRLPQNRNVHVDPKNSIGTVWDGERWVRKPKTEIIDNSIKQTARNMSDRMDIVGVEAPERMVAVLELLASEGLTPDIEILNAEGLEQLTHAERRSLFNGLVSILVK